MIRKSFTRRLSNLLNPRIASTLIVAGLVLVGITGLGAQPVQAAAGINQTVNYQGRLLSSTGAVIPDGNYNMEFKIYQDGAGTASGNPGGTLKWTEDWLGVNSQAVTVKNGYFSVNLGTINAFAAQVNWNWDTLWLSQTVVSGANATSTVCTTFALCNTGSELEMLPMKRLSSAVYALQAQSASTCTGCILQSPANAAQNTISPNQASTTVALTVNANIGAAASAAMVVNQTQAADGVQVGVSNGTGTATNGLQVAKTGGGTLTNALSVTNATGTTVNGLSVSNTSGTLTNGVAFSGTIGTDIARATGTLTMQGGSGITGTTGGAVAFAEQGAGVGTVSNSAASAAVVGVGTLFTQALKFGDTFTVTSTGNTCTVSVITDATHLTCSAPLASLSSGSAYTITSAGTRMTILGNGNVGIGTTAPAVALDVVGQQTVAGTSATEFRVQNASGLNLLTADTVNKIVTLGASTSGGDLYVGTGALPHLFADGLESGNLGLWSSVNGAPVADTAQARAGKYALKINTSASIQNAYWQTTDQTTGFATMYARMYVYATNNPSTTDRVLFYLSDGTAHEIQVVRNTSGTLGIKYDTTAATYTGATALALNGWHKLELTGTLHTGGTGTYKLTYDGVVLYNVTNASAAVTNNLFEMQLGDDNNATQTFWADDVVIDSAVPTNTDSQSLHVNDALQTSGSLSVAGQSYFQGDTYTNGQLFLGQNAASPAATLGDVSLMENSSLYWDEYYDGGADVWRRGAQAGDVGININTANNGLSFITATAGANPGGTSVTGEKTAMKVTATGLQLGEGTGGGSLAQTGLLLWANSAGTHTVGIQGPSSDPVSSYTLTLPATAPLVSQCLQSDSATATLLKFASCDGNVTLQSTYNSSAVSPEIQLNTTQGALEIRQDSGATLSNLLTVQNAAGTINYLQVHTSGISVAGSVNVGTGTVVADFFRSADQSAASTPSDTTTYTSGQTSGATSNTGGVTVRSGNATTSGNTGTVLIKSGDATSGNSGNINIIVGTATGTIGAISVGDQAVNSKIINIGSNANAGTSTVQIATDATNAQTVKIGSTSGSSTTTIQGGTGDINLTTNAVGAGVAVKTLTNDTAAFQVQNASGTAALSVDTTYLATNLIPNGSFESAVSLWAVKAGTATGPAQDSTVNGAFTGNSTLKTAFTSTAAGDGIKYTPASTLAAGTYSLTFNIKQTAGTNFGTVGVGATNNLRVGTNNGADNDCTLVTADSYNTITTASGWLRLRCTFTTTGTTTFVYWKQNDAGSGRTYFLDAVQLEQATTTGPFTDSTIALNGVVNSRVAFQNAADSTSAFQIQSAGDETMLNVDTANSIVTLVGRGNDDTAAWLTSNNSLPAIRGYGQTVTANGYIYEVGGWDTSISDTTVYYAKLGSDGNPGAFTTTTALSTGVHSEGVVVSNGYMFVIGGLTNPAGTVQSLVYSAKLNSDGTLGAWTQQTSLPAGRFDGTTVAMNGYIYVVDGAITTTPTSATVSYYAKVNANGTITAWNSLTAQPNGTTGIIREAGVAANGYIYILGGYFGSSLTTVYYAKPNSTTGDVASWTTASTSLPAARSTATPVVVNGNIYLMGGDTTGTILASVVYAHLNADGSLGSWQTSASSLPAARNNAGTVGSTANGYIYYLGGNNSGGTPQTTVYYTSTARVQIGGSLDLVGLQGNNMSDAGNASSGSTGGSLTAGNGTFVGSLTVAGEGTFNQGLTVNGSSTINALNAGAGQTLFDVNNSLGNSIFTIRQMSVQFGSLVKAGGFEARNSYFGEEYNIGKLTACAPAGAAAGASINSFARGDAGGQGTAGACSGTANATINGGELNFSTSTGGTTTFGSCSATSPGITTVNGVERITATSVNTAGSKATCVENIAASTTTSNKIYSATNLPVITMKVRPQTLTSTNNAIIVAGLNNQDSAANQTTTLPITGLFFTNCSGYTVTTRVATGCSNTTWYGMASNGSTQVGTTQACTGAMSNTQFAYLRIEVRGTSDVHFFADVDTSDGINEIECGTGITTAVSTASMTAWLEAAYIAQPGSTTSTILDVDYFRSWQDDNRGSAEDLPDVQTVAPVSSDSPVFADKVGLINFVSATSEDTVFDHDVYVRGTLYADKIKANQIEGLDVLAGKLDGLQAELAAGGTGGVQVGDAKVPLNMAVAGGLNVGGDADFHGSVFFRGLVTFVEKTIFKNDVSFEGKVTFNNDAAGYAVIHPGQQEVSVKFDKPYEQKPVVVVSLSNGLFEQFSYTDVTPQGFKIVLPKAAASELQFSWFAASVKDAKTTEVPLPSPTPTASPPPRL